MFNEPPQVYIKFRGCFLYLYLDTDFNNPNFDVNPSTLATFAKNPDAGDGDPCRTETNVEYQLRRGPTNQQVLFNIYPSPGDAANVIYIQGRDRRSACLDRSFLQWNEKNCSKTKNLIKPSYNILDLYIASQPTLAKVDLVGPLQASKWELVKFDGDNFYDCGALAAKNMRIAPY